MKTSLSRALPILRILSVRDMVKLKLSLLYDRLCSMLPTHFSSVIAASWMFIYSWKNKPVHQFSISDYENLRTELELLKRQHYKVDVTLNADTAHPRLEVSEDGKSVNDTGVIRQVPSKEERFDSHIFVLAKEGYTSGRKYWEVDVGKRRNWILGVASESVARKGTVNLSPKNGFWVIGLTDGEEYWAHTDPWTRLTASGRPQKIGVFLDISANKLSFYDAKKKSALYTFTSIGDGRLERKFIPFFSTGSGVSALDTEPLKIVQGFDDDWSYD
ncbi:butyrophilin subfamily 1 member A1-like isoform X1 [Tympanuchus pallidicinctus]|uniref:butyrophilin subfamily 1 member A1-like isoform X1 n=1 Tax=Tympanuchus pallidicinctus TaxID=109042 RepID=UPI0022873D95|nr:butyrophilin subfamily 1 member A1-like isoform X1 [Tympanuchus pallidicinctus]XP_052561132.1 butyrophilin subfamily 1 member A1-like isoform X1 [Tympanuchus pallidicinctus]